MAAAILTAFLWAQVAAEPAGAVAPAMPAPVELSWVAPAECPDAEAVRAGIARGVPSAPGGVARVRAAVVVTPLDADHWRAALELEGADWRATRTLKGPTCAAVADAAGLVIVLALATELQEREVVVEAPPPPPPPPPPAPPPSSPTVGVSALADAGTLPDATPGLGLSLGWRWARARLDLRGAFFRDRRGTIASQPDTGATLSLVSGSVRGCRMWGGALSAGPCVAGGLDRLGGQGFGPISTSEGSKFTPVLGGGLLLEWRLSRWVGAVLSAEAAIPLVRGRFSIEHVGQVHQPAAVSFRGAAGLEVRFR